MRVPEIAARGVAVVVLLVGAVLAVRMGAADLAEESMDLEGLERAVRLAPGNADYHRWLGVAVLTRDVPRSEREFREAVRLNPWDADSRMRLGMLLEAQGHIGEAERQLIETARLDATYLPRWGRWPISNSAREIWLNSEPGASGRSHELWRPECSVRLGRRCGRDPGSGPARAGGRRDLGKLPGMEHR